LRAEVALLRTAQEALANVRKHAGADLAVLTLSFMDDRVTLDVRDDGVGFDPAAPNNGSDNGGFGLDGMRQRAALLGGTFSIESARGAGTTLTVELPAGHGETA
jgi:signal transduction histidine kinase